MAAVSRRTQRHHIGSPPRGSKQWLLPMPHESVRSLSLNAHLALEACRAGNGNRHMLNELTRLTYLSYFLWETGLGHAGRDVYEAAEDVLNAAVEEAVRTGKWIVAAGDAPTIEQMLKVYDEQLSSVSARDYCNAMHRLDKLLYVPRTVSPVVRDATRAA